MANLKKRAQEEKRTKKQEKKMVLIALGVTAVVLILTYIAFRSTQ